MIHNHLSSYRDQADHAHAVNRWPHPPPTMIHNHLIPEMITMTAVTVILKSVATSIARMYA